MWPQLLANYNGGGSVISGPKWPIRGSNDTKTVSCQLKAFEGAGEIVRLRFRTRDDAAVPCPHIRQGPSSSLIHHTQADFLIENASFHACFFLLASSLLFSLEPFVENALFLTDFPPISHRECFVANQKKCIRSSGMHAHTPNPNP